MGANPADRLVETQWDGSIPNFRRTGYPVLGHDHLVAGALRRQLSSEPSCCQNNGALWDLAVLYGKQTQWGNSSPLFADGTVVKAASSLGKQLAALSDGMVEH